MVAGRDDDLIPLSCLFSPPRLNRHHLTPPPSPPPPPPPPPLAPPRNGSDVTFSRGDLVWAKAFPYTWWPGLLRRTRGSSALVHLFGGGEKPLWFRPSRLRAFEDGYASSSFSRAKLSAEIALALEELGRRTLLGLMCPCQRSLVGSCRLPRGAAGRARSAFVAVDLAHFVRQRAVCAWGDGGEEDDPCAVKLLAGVIAFRRSFSFVGRKGDFDARRVAGTVLDMAVGNVVGGNSVDRIVEIVMAYRRFVSEAPNWVFRELMDVGGDSSSSEGSEGSDGEWLEESFVGSFYIEDADGTVSTRADIGSSSNIITDSLVGVEELTNYFQEETRMVVNSSSHGISAVNPVTEVPGNCTLNTEMDLDSFFEDADNAIEEERMELINSRSELRSGESIILQDHPETFLEFGKEQGCTACHNGYKTKGETTDILQASLTELHSLASDPCHSLKKNHKAKFAVLLKLRSFLFRNAFASESMGPIAIHDDLETSNVPAPEQDLSHFSVGNGHLKDGGVYRSDVMYEVAPCANNTSASSQGHQFCMMEIDEVVNAIVNRDSEVGCHELLEDIRFLAVDVFCLGSQNLELLCQSFLHLRQLTFLNMSDVLSTPSSVIPHPSNSELEEHDISKCNHGASYSDSFQEKQSYFVSGTQKLVESSPKETDIPSAVDNDILDPKKRTESNHMADSRSHLLSDMPLDCQKCLPSRQSNFAERECLKAYECLCHLKNFAVDLFCSKACFVEETCQMFLHYRKLAFLNNFHHSVDHDIKFSFGREDGFVSRNKQSVQIEKNSGTSCAGMEKMHNMTERCSTTCAHHVLSKISADNANTEDPCICITSKDVTDFQNRLDSDTLIEVGANIVPNSSLNGASNCDSGSIKKTIISKSVASGNSDVETVSGLSGASNCDAVSFKKRIVDESFASGNCEICQTEILRPEIDLISPSSGEILHVNRDAADNMDMGTNTVKIDHTSSQYLSSMDEDAKRNEATPLVARGYGITPGPILKDNFHGKRRHEHTLPYQSKVQKNQPEFSLGRLYASPLMAETSKPAQKVKSANKSKYTALCKTLHMKFPKDFKLPSKEELEKKFQVFGRLDRSRTKIFFYTGAAKVVFLKAADAQVAYVHAIKKRVFSCVDVRFWFDEHEMFREGNTRGPLSISPGEPSLNLKSCLRKPDTHKEKDRRKVYKVKFTADNSPCPSTASSKTAYFPSTISDNIPSQAEDISRSMLHLLVKCDEVVTAIKKALGLESYYSIFAYAYDLSSKS